MRKPLVISAHLVALWLHTTAYASEPLSILSLPLGGKLAKTPRECSFHEIGGDPKELCWVAPPYIHKDGSRSGSVEVPNRQGRPAWAENVIFKIDISKDRTVNKIAVRTVDSLRKVEIEKSISLRFGYPTEPRYTGPNSYSANWNLPDIHIRMLCSDPAFCNIEFSSPAQNEALQRELAARAKAAASRPITP